MGPAHGDGPSEEDQMVGVQPSSEAVVLDTGMGLPEITPHEDESSDHHSERSTVREDDSSECCPEKERDGLPDGNAQM